MTLVILAAGLGSRYGGLKQLDPVGPCGEFIIDYSVFDAVKSGFDEVCFIIRKEHHEDFKSTIGDRIAKTVKVSYAFQAMDDLPDGFCVPEGRTKPWGTAHALLCAKDVVKGDFAVLNADDFYGREAFAAIFDYMKDRKRGDAVTHYCMAGYLLKNTITDNGHVSRGVCVVNEDSTLNSIVERTKIEKRPDGNIAYIENDVWHPLPEDTAVSMNIFGFSDDIFAKLEEGFVDFLKDDSNDKLKGEFFLPLAIEYMKAKNFADVTVLNCNAKWYGVTYREDREAMVAFLKASTENGMYKKGLWE